MVKLFPPKMDSNPDFMKVKFNYVDKNLDIELPENEDDTQTVD